MMTRDEARRALQAREAAHDRKQQYQDCWANTIAERVARGEGVGQASLDQWTLAHAETAEAAADLADARALWRLTAALPAAAPAPPSTPPQTP